jgi:hypothetical protein
VIGQRLHEAGVDGFQLIKQDDRYIVQAAADPIGDALQGRKFPTAKDSPLGYVNDQANFPALTFTAAEICGADREARLSRSRDDSVPDIGRLSVAMRVLGDYLDRHGAADFVIFWSKSVVKLRCGENEQFFSSHNLYDLGVVMHLRGSERPVRNHSTQRR